MKKNIYVAPTVKVVNIQPMQMMAGSPADGANTKDGYANPGKETLSRRARFSDWDFEEEE